MPTVIDSLVVTLGLDPAGLTAGQKKAIEDFRKTKAEASTTAKAIEAEGKKAAEFYAGLKREALGLFAVIAGGLGIKEFVSQTVTSSAAVGRLAENLNVATEDLSAWQGVLARSGGTAADANNIFQTLADTLTGIELGQPDTGKVAVLRRLGITIDDLRDIPGAALKIADALNQIGDARQRSALTQQLFGPNVAITNLLAQGAPRIREQLEIQRRLRVVTDQDADAAKRLQNEFSSLKQASSAIGLELLTALEPAIVFVTRALTRLSEWAQDHPQLVAAAFVGIATAITAMSVAMAIGAAAALGLNAALLPEIALISAIAGEVAYAIPLFQRLGSAVGDIRWGDLWKSITTGDRTGVTAALAGVELMRPTTQAERDAAARARAQARAGAGGVPFAAGFVGAPSSASALDQAMAILRSKEGFQPTAKYDVNAYRAGYGSDTKTDARTGAVSRVTSSTTVSRDDAEADLRRRTAAYLASSQRAVGASWANLNATTQAALASVAYNYGSLPKAVLDAAQTGNAAAVATAIQHLAGDNGGIRADRYNTLAANVRASSPASGLPPVGAAGAALVGTTANDNRRTSSSETNIGQITVNAGAGDARTIARDIGGAIQANPIVAQANTGLR